MTDKKVPKAAFMARKGKERRRWKRISAKIRVILKDSDTFVPLITRNIDPGGLFLQTDEPKGRLELVNLRIDMGKGQPPLSTLGVVKHAINKARARELNRIPGMGIQFYGLSSSDQQRWNAMVARMAALEAETEQPAQEEPTGPMAAEISGAQPEVERGAEEDRIALTEEERAEQEPSFMVEGLADILEGDQAQDIGFEPDSAAQEREYTIQQDIDQPAMQADLADLLEGEGSQQLYELVTEPEGKPSGEPQDEMSMPDDSGLADLLEGDTPHPLASVTPLKVEGVRREFEIRLPDVDKLRAFIERDIPIGGTFIPTPDPLEIGSQVLVNLIHPETEEVFPIEGTVVRIHEGSSTQPRGMGVRFQGLTEMHREGLEKFVVYGFNVL